MSNDEKKKLKDKETIIKRIKISFEKKLIGQTKILNWRVKLKKNQINKWIKKILIFNELNDDRWNFKKIMKNDWSQPNPIFRIL